MKNVEYIKPTGIFTNYIYKAIPLAFDESMSYYETLCSLLDYLKTTTDVVNNNAELLAELESYVKNYFDNLDVQEEINNKLDAMVQDGTMDEIINQEIFSDLNDAIDDVQEDVDTLKRVALYIGNSYLTGVGSTGNNNGIYNRTKSMFYKSYSKTEGGIGFLAYTGHSNTFQTMLQNAINDSNINNDEITDIIVVSAWGDTRALQESASWSTWRSDLQTAIQTFITTINNNFSNIKRVSCMLGESRGQKHIDDSSLYDNAFWVHHSFIDILPKNQMEYLGWIGFNLFLNSSYFSSDHYHPNDIGYKLLASQFKTAYSGTLSYEPIKRNWSSRPCNIIDGSSIGGYITLTPDIAQLTIQELQLVAGTTPAHNTNGPILFDFGVNLPFSLPMPNGQTTNLKLMDGFTCTTQGGSDANFNASNNYMGRLILMKSENDIDSTAIKLLTIGVAKTVSGTIASICTPSIISWSLARFN